MCLHSTVFLGCLTNFEKQDLHLEQQLWVQHKVSPSIVAQHTQTQCSRSPLLAWNTRENAEIDASSS